LKRSVDAQHSAVLHVSLLLLPDEMSAQLECRLPIIWPINIQRVHGRKPRLGHTRSLTHALTAQQYDSLQRFAQNRMLNYFIYNGLTVKQPTGALSVTVKIAVLWRMTPCKFIDNYRRFERSYWLRLKRVKMEVYVSPKRR
jgi:hypothetical protein